MENIKAYFFDIDGTLLNSSGAGRKAIEKTFSESFSIEKVKKTRDYAGRTDMGILNEIFNLHSVPLNPINVEQFYCEYAKNLEYFLQKNKGFLLTGVKETLQQVNGFSNTLVSVLTGNCKQGAFLKLKFNDIFKEFNLTKAVFGDSYNDRNKLASKALENTKEYFFDSKVKANQILIVGDTPHDVACAKSIGAKSLAVCSGFSSKKELENSNPDYLVDDLSQFDFLKISN